MKVIDMHCDTISEIRYSRGTAHPQKLSENTLQIDLGKMEQGDYMLQNFAMFVDMQRKEDPFSSVIHLIDLFYEEIEKYPNRIRPVRTYKDIIENQEQGIMSALLAVEEGGVCKGDPAFLRTLYRLGVRMLTLTWNYTNEFGNPNFYVSEMYENTTPEFDGSKGLTEQGIGLIAEMEKMGMIIDVSHLSDNGFWDVVKHSEKPFVASHSNARALCGHGRNLTDNMIRALAEKGGVVGLNYLGMFLDKRDETTGVCPSRVKRIAEHARYIMNIGGMDCVGLGSDFDGITGDLEMKDCSMVPLLEQELRRQGFHESEIEKIFYKNVLQLYKEILK